MRNTIDELLADFPEVPPEIRPKNLTAINPAGRESRYMVGFGENARSVQGKTVHTPHREVVDFVRCPVPG